MNTSGKAYRDRYCSIAAAYRVITFGVVRYEMELKRAIKQKRGHGVEGIIVMMRR